MSSFVAAMDSRIRGENGAMCLAQSGNALLSLFYRLVRDLDDASLETLYNAALAEANATANTAALADLIVLVFQTRYCRGGKGEKRLFYTLFALLVKTIGMETAQALLPLVPEYGSFKDLLALQEVSAALTEPALAVMADALRTDEAELETALKEKRTPKLSLSGKWAPRENGAYDKKSGAASKLARLMYPAISKPSAARKYRKLVASLNGALATPEVLMAAGRYAEIKFAGVGSLCLQRHRKAFLNETCKGKVASAMEETGNRHPNDADRVAARVHLREAMVKKGVKGKQLGPHEITAKLMAHRRGNVSTAERDLMQAQWVAIRKGVEETLAKAAEQRDAEVLLAAAPSTAAASGTADALASVAALKAALPKSVNLGKLVPLVDVSGSMHGTPMEVAIAMGILVSELTSAEFKDRVLTFESRPNWVGLSGCADIADKVSTVQSADWGGSTDFAAACERILDVAETHKLSPDSIPDLIVFSDMQFDEARGAHSYGFHTQRVSSWETHYERLERRFAEVGVAVCGQPYAPPQIIFWNLRGNAVGFPVAKDAPNTQLLSGFSPSLLKLVLTGAELVAEEEEVTMPDGTVKVKKSGPTPEQTLRAALDDEAYDAVRMKLSALTSGPLAAYSFAKEEAGFELVDLQ